MKLKIQVVVVALTVSLTNCLCRGSDKAMTIYQQIHNDISTLPPEIGKQCVKAVASSVLSVPYERMELR